MPPTIFRVSSFITLLIVTLAYTITTAALAQGANGKLKFGINENYAPPFILVNQSGHITGGILFDLMTAIAEETNLKPEPVQLPRNRIEQFLSDDSVDIICRAKKAWMRDPEKYVWSEDLFDTEEVVIAQAGVGAITSLEQLNHHSLGTVLGFEYPQLASAIQHQDLVRDDAPSENNVLKKMVAGRNDYAIVDAQTYYYFIRKNNVANRFAKNPYLLQTHQTACAISKKTSIPIRELLDAIHKIKSSGKMAAILKTEY